VPSTIAARPGESILDFRFDSTISRQPVRATIRAQMGAFSAEASLDMVGGPRTAPTSPRLVKIGEPLSLRIPLVDVARQVFATSLPPDASFEAASGTFEWTPAATQQGVYELVFTGIDDTGQTETEHITLEVDSGAPRIDAVLHAATRSRDAACSPGSIATLEGRWLTDGSTAADPTGTSTQLSGLAVFVNGAPAHLLSASPDRVDFLCPRADPGSTLEIVADTPTGATPSIRTISRSLAPGIFSVDGAGSGQGSILHARSSKLAAIRNPRVDAEPALRGDAIVVYATGLNGSTRVSAVLEGLDAAVDSVEPTPGFAGISTVTLTLPEIRSAVDRPASLQLTAVSPDGSLVESNTVTLAIGYPLR
jgi:uncharacterized protein (TIGR03437 family)